MKRVELDSEFDVSLLPLSTAQLIKDVTDPVPHDLLKNLRTIHLEVRDEDEAAGEHKLYSWEGMLMGSTIHLRFDVEVLKQAGERKKVIVEQAVKYGWHELGHAAHNTMDLKEMVGWENVMINDNSNITDYVERMDQGKEYDRRKREDFSESFAIFIANPLYLNVISPERYKFIKGLLTDRSSDAELEKMNERIVYLTEKQAELWKEKGITEKQIREDFQNGKRDFNYLLYPSKTMIA